MSWTGRAASLGVVTVTRARSWWVVLVNTGFVLLNLFHLAYLGVMFDVTNEEPGLQEQVRITMSDRAATYELYYACM